MERLRQGEQILKASMFYLLSTGEPVSYIIRPCQRKGSLLFQRQLHLLIQCQPCFWDMRMKINLNGFCPLRHQDTRAAFNCIKLILFPPMTSSLISTMCSIGSNMIPSTVSSRTVKVKNKKTNISVGNLSPSSRSEVPPSNGDCWVCFGVHRYLCYQEKAGTYLKVEPKESLSLPVLLIPPVCGTTHLRWSVFPLVPPIVQPSQPNRLWQHWNCLRFVTTTHTITTNQKMVGNPSLETVLWQPWGYPKHQSCSH